MKEIGRLADSLKASAPAALIKDVRCLMRLLIDTVYLYLTKPRVSDSEWNNACQKIREATAVLKNVF